MDEEKSRGLNLRGLVIENADSQREEDSMDGSLALISLTGLCCGSIVVVVAVEIGIVVVLCQSFLC